MVSFKRKKQALYVRLIMKRNMPVISIVLAISNLFSLFIVAEVPAWFIFSMSMTAAFYTYHLLFPFRSAVAVQRMRKPVPESFPLTKK